MLDEAAALPDDPEDLRAFTARLLAEVKAQAILIEKLRHQLAGHRVHRFGVSSETADQLQLALETSEIAAAAMTAQLRLPDVEPRDKPKRRPIPDHVPRMEVELATGEESCSGCGGTLRRDAAAARRGHYRGAGIRAWTVHREPDRAAAPGLRGLRSLRAGAIAVATDRAGPPRTRPAGACSGQQVRRPSAALPPEPDLRPRRHRSRSLDPGRLGRQVDRAARALADAIGRHVLGGDAIFADDTPVSMLAPGTGKTRTARLWTYARDERTWGGEAPPAAWYRFSGDRKGRHPKDHLAGFRGWMHADGYAGFEDLYRGGHICEVACMAHIRRKFVDVHRAQGSPIADEAIRRIAQLYAIERAVRGSPPDRRVEIRQAKARPIFDDLDAWLARQLTTISGKTPLAAAIRYALTRMGRLRPYLENGILELDNNAAERAMRAIALGRKNYLFVGSASGGKAAAIAYTLIETAKLNGVDPQTWLADTLARMPDYKIT